MEVATQTATRPEIDEEYLGRTLAPLLSLNAAPPMSGDARDRLSPLQRSYLDEAVMRLWNNFSPALAELKQLREERVNGFTKAVAAAREERFRKCDADPRVFVRHLREIDPEDPGELSDLRFRLTEGAATEALAEREKRAADRAAKLASIASFEEAVEIIEVMADIADGASFRTTDEAKIVAHREAEDRLREAARRIRTRAEIT